MTVAPADVPRHGGDLRYATRTYGLPPDGWLDLSTGINPTPYPRTEISGEALSRLPDAGMVERIILSARALYRAGEASRILPVPGSEAAIHALPRVAPQGPVAILSPSYRSHAEAWRNAGRSVREVASFAEVPGDCAVVVLSRPNNPDGRVGSADEIIRWAEALARQGGLLVADEAFADPDPDLSLAPLAGNLPIMVLRSFGKFFGLPGLRLGFAIGPAEPVEALRRGIGDWPVSGPALEIGIRALEDGEWIAAQRSRLKASHTRLDMLLRDSGLDIVGHATLFTTLAHRRAYALHEALARDGVWTRRFPERPEWLRLGLPDEAGFPRLERALRRAIASNG